MWQLERHDEVVSISHRRWTEQCVTHGWLLTLDWCTSAWIGSSWQWKGSLALPLTINSAGRTNGAGCCVGVWVGVSRQWKGLLALPIEINSAGGMNGAGCCVGAWVGSSWQWKGWLALPVKINSVGGTNGAGCCVGAGVGIARIFSWLLSLNECQRPLVDVCVLWVNSQCKILLNVAPWNKCCLQMVGSELRNSGLLEITGSRRLMAHRLIVACTTCCAACNLEVNSENELPCKGALERNNVLETINPPNCHF